jgi:hypothetical protein
MNRRHFMKTTAVSFGLTATPQFILQAFGSEPSSKTLAFDAYRRARRAGHSLLVFVIPANPNERWPRGSALGAFITYATDAQLAPLARCEVVCATAAHIHDLVPKAPGGEPLAFLITTTAVPANVAAINATLADPNVRDQNYEDYRDAVAAMDQIVMTNVASIADAFGAALGPADPKLAAGVRERLSKRDVPGARWASSAGCGVTYEHPDKGDDAMGMVDCGMGSVSEKSRRFLELLADPGT